MAIGYIGQGRQTISRQRRDWYYVMPAALSEI